MEIQSIFNNIPVERTSNKFNSNNMSPSETEGSFSNLLKNAINNVNAQQVKSDQLTEKLVKGQDVELHEVMIAAEKASISLNATLEFRNKVVEAYQEIIRMQV